MIIILFNVYAAWLHEVEKGSVVARTAQSLAVRSCGCTLSSHTQQKGRKQRRLRKKGEEVSGKSYPHPRHTNQNSILRIKIQLFPPPLERAKISRLSKDNVLFFRNPPNQATVQNINTTGLFKETGTSTLMC